MTSSATASRTGTSMPSVLAVCRRMTSSNFVARIDEHDKAHGPRQQLMLETELLSCNFNANGGEAGDVVARPVDRKFRRA
jgi:hypothetical protein